MIKKYTIKLELGLHARPSGALFTQMLKFNLEKAELIWGEKTGDLRSIIGILSMGIPCKSDFSVEVIGTDEQKAIEFLDEFFNIVDESEMYAKYDPKAH
jgi:phosphocarrier protein HPr